jgi:hypothetical protein
VLTEMIDIAQWTVEQWIAACILVFIVVTILLVAHRLIKIFQISKKSKYRPNLRILRRTHLGREVK